MIQIDMDMPKDCADCNFSCPRNGYDFYCCVDLKDVDLSNPRKDCPLKEVPSGKWNIIADRYMCCPNCGHKIDTWHGIIHDINFNYCPNCGSRNVVEEQKGEDT